jgi:membrane fusion protein, heavy metal efflux system
MNKLILIYVSVLAVSCGGPIDKATKEAMNMSLANDTIFVNETSPILDHIITQRSQFQDFSAEFKTIGTVRPVSGRYAEIAPPFAGRIVKSYVKLGQKVGAGSPIFDLSSAEFYEATRAYFAAQSANELAQRIYNRQKELAANGVASQRDLEQAQSGASISNQELEQAKATLSIFNTDVTSLQMGQPLQVVSPISGEVVKSNVTIGSYAREDSEPLAVVADLSRVWVAALVKERYFGAIKPGDRVEVNTSANPNNIINGTIYYISEMLENETRSLEVIIECNNSNRDLKLGMFCDVHFLSSPTKAIILPSTAIMQEQDNDYVLIEESKGKYVRRRVESESVNMDNVHITRGLREGENVVIKGGIYFNM